MISKAITAHLKGLFGLVAVFLLVPGPVNAAEHHCVAALQYLQDQYESDPATEKAFDAVHAGLADLPTGYSYNQSRINPWRSTGGGKGLHRKLSEMFSRWCSVLPKIQGDSDNALDPILYFAWFYYKNPAGVDFVQGRDPTDPGKSLGTGPSFLALWNQGYRKYMDSEASARLVPEWVADPRIEIQDYQKGRADDYKNWNQFFARDLKTDAEGNYPSRPVTMPDRDYVIVSPTDCIMNPLVQMMVDDEGQYHRVSVENPLQLDTVLDVKNIPISVNDMLGGAPEELKQHFKNGTGLACVLTPNHHRGGI